MKPPGRGQQALKNIPYQCISAPKLGPSQIAHPIQMGRNINHQLAWSRYHGFQRCCCSHPMLAATLGPRTVPVSMPFKETLLFKRPVKSDLDLLSRIKILGTDFNSWHQLHWGYLLLQWVRVCWKIIWRRIPADLPSHLQQVLSAWQIPQSMSGRAQPGIPIVQIGSTGTCRKQFSPWKRLLLCDYMKLISNRKVAHHLSSEWSRGIRAHVSHVGINMHPNLSDSSFAQFSGILKSQKHWRITWQVANQRVFFSSSSTNPMADARMDMVAWKSVSSCLDAVEICIFRISSKWPICLSVTTIPVVFSHGVLWLARFEPTS